MDIIDPTGQILLGLGAMLLLGLATDALGRRTPLPRVTLMLLFGMVIGEAGFDLVPAALTENFDLIANMALLMIGFLLGERLTRKQFARAGRQVACLVLGESFGAGLLVFLALVAVGAPVALAMPLAGISTASAPAATIDVIREEGAHGPFTDTLLGVVALDDVIGLLIFSLGLALALAVEGHANGTTPLMLAARDIGGAMLVGAAVGIPGAYLSGRISVGEPLLVEALGMVFLCGGLALLFEVSFLVAAMTMGAAVANLARHHEQPFHAIEGIEWPFMILFFTLAGATLEVDSLASIGTIGLVYLVARTGGLIGGCRLGAMLAHSEAAVRQNMGMALLPQAGVAMGMALVAANQLPDHRQTLLSIVISTTIVFEIVGPVFTRRALRLSGESGVAGTDTKTEPGPT